MHHLTGHAVLRLRNGNTYVGWATYDGKLVTIAGSLRVIVNKVVEYRPRPPRSVPVSAVREIVWDDDAVWLPE